MASSFSTFDAGCVFDASRFPFSSLVSQGILLSETASSAQNAGLQNGQPAQVHGQKSDRGDPVGQPVRKEQLENCNTDTACVFSFWIQGSMTFSWVPAQALGSIADLLCSTVPPERVDRADLSVLQKQ